MKSSEKLVGPLLCAFLLLAGSGCRKTTTPEKQTELLRKRAELEMNTFIAACEEYRRDKGMFPHDPAVLYGKDSYLVRPTIGDPWETNYKYSVNPNYVSVASAGQDRQWGTSDDLSRQSPAQPETGSGAQR